MPKPVPAPDYALDKGLPCNLDAERFTLGSVLMDDSLYVQVASSLNPEDFSLEKHRRIFLRMGELAGRSERIDRVTLANELMKQAQLESVDGISYLVSLDEGLPALANFDSYVRIVKDKAALRKIIFTSQKLIQRCLVADGEPEELAQAAVTSLVELTERREDHGPERAFDTIVNYEGGLNGFFDNTVLNNRGLKTGFTRFDEMTGGLQKQDLIVIGGRPSSGKTAISLNMAAHSAIREGKSVGVFSLEMTKHSLLTRLVCCEARVDSQKFRAGYMNQDERRRLTRAASELEKVRLFIDDRKSCTILDIHTAARKLKKKHGLDLIVIDYLQLMSLHVKTDNRAQAIGAITHYIKNQIVGDLDVPVILISQLNRDPEKRTGDHRPRMSDFKESGDIEQDCDVGCGVFREEMYHKNREDLHGVAELSILKQRNGPVGIIKLVFLSSFVRFENRVSDVTEVPDDPRSGS